MFRLLINSRAYLFPIIVRRLMHRISIRARGVYSANTQYGGVLAVWSFVCFDFTQCVAYKMLRNRNVGTPAYAR